MKRFFFIAFVLCSQFAFGQPNGAANPVDAWNGGVPNEFWFEMYTTGDYVNGDWINKSASSRSISFNRDNISVYNFEFQQTPLYLQNTYDYIYETFWMDNLIDGFENWFVFRIPSTRKMTIEFDLFGNSTGNPSEVFGSTLMFYQIINDSDFQNKISTNYFLYNNSFYNVEYYDDLITKRIIELSETMPTSDANFLSSSNFILMRIGNNDENESNLFFTPFQIKVYTDNNLCESALKFPDTNEAFSDTLDSDVKNLLTGDDEISQTYFANNQIVGMTGSADPNGLILPSDVTNNIAGSGEWFKISTTETNLYFSACGSAIDPQLVVFNDCPILSPEDNGTGKIIGAENDNLFDGSDLNLNGGIDVCLDDPGNIEIPVIKVSTGAPITLYAYLFGNNEMGLFDFYITKDNGGILPVEWLDFSGKALSKTNQLFWSTASESQNDHFLLEKSGDGENYEELAKIPGAGNSAFEKHYQFIDLNPFTTSYYRIAQVDWDGTLNRGLEIVIVNESIYAQFSILNNPIINSELKIRCKLEKTKVLTMEVFSIKGQKVYSSLQTIAKGETILSIALPNLIDGVYLLKIYDLNIDYSQKISIQSTN